MIGDETTDEETGPSLPVKDWDTETVTAIAAMMSGAIAGEFPTGPIQTGAFNATATWIGYLLDVAEENGQKEG